MSGAPQLEGFAEAAGQILAKSRQEWKAERELAQAETRRTIAELEAKVSTLALQLHEMAAAKLATLRDGKDGAAGIDGKDADLVDIERMIITQVDAFPKAVSPEAIAACIREEVAEVIREFRIEAGVIESRVAAKIDMAVKSLPVPADGHSPTAEELAPIVETAVSHAFSALPQPKDGEPGSPGINGEDGHEGPAGSDGVDADPEAIAGLVTERVLPELAERLESDISRVRSDIELGLEAVNRSLVGDEVRRALERGIEGDCAPDDVSELVSKAIAALAESQPLAGPGTPPLVLNIITPQLTTAAGLVTED